MEDIILCHESMVRLGYSYILKRIRQHRKRELELRRNMNEILEKVEAPRSICN